jgi:hypothetical protein
MTTKLTQDTRPDPLLHDFEMPLRAIYHPLGFPVEIETNSREVLAAAQESWGHFQKAYHAPRLRLCIGVLDDGSKSCARPPLVRARRSLMSRVADASNFSVSDVGRGFAFAWLTRATVADTAYLRWHFIEGMAWDLLEPRVTAIHAACLRKGDRGFLLCGDSGAGKSSLAYACALSGWTYLTDDSCCLARGEQERTVIGNPHQIRFRTSAVKLFPELKEQCPRLRVNGEKIGELAFELPTAKLPGISITTKSFVDYIVFINRNHHGPASLTPFSKDTALRWFEQVIHLRERKMVNAHKAALRKLAEARIFELRYTDLDSAIKELEMLAVSDRLATSTAWASVEGADNV